jgi:hypothetical protein
MHCFVCAFSLMVFCQKDMEVKKEEQTKVKPEENAEEKRDEQTANKANQKNHSAVYTIVNQFIFCKDISHLISLYLVIPASYYINLQGFQSLTFFKHASYGNLCFGLKAIDKTIHVLSKDNNWSFLRKICVNSYNIGNRHSFAIWGNYILLTDSLHHCIRYIDVSQNDFSHWNCMHLIGSSGFGDHNFFYPLAIAVVNDRCLVADYENFRVQCFLLSLQNGKCHITFQTSIAMGSCVLNVHLDSVTDKIFAILHKQMAMYEVHVIDNQNRSSLVQTINGHCLLPHILSDTLVFIPYSTYILTIELKTGKVRTINIPNSAASNRTDVSIHNRYLFILKAKFTFVIHLDDLFL